jgi:hypothetical protein
VTRIWKDWKPRLGPRCNSNYPAVSGLTKPVFLKLVQRKQSVATSLYWQPIPTPVCYSGSVQSHTEINKVSQTDNTILCLNLALQCNFWDSSSYANKVFILQQKIIRIIANAGPRDSCRETFRNMQILTLYSQYIYSVLFFTVNNKQMFTINNEIHKYATRNNNNLHPTLTNLTKFNKRSYIMSIKVFNHLPQSLKALVHNLKQFSSSLKRFLYYHSFYSMEKYC